MNPFEPLMAAVVFVAAMRALGDREDMAATLLFSLLALSIGWHTYRVFAV